MFRSRIAQLVALAVILGTALASLPTSVFAQSSERLLYAFAGAPDCGGSPLAPMIADASGTHRSPCV